MAYTILTDAPITQNNNHNNIIQHLSSLATTTYVQVYHIVHVPPYLHRPSLMSTDQGRSQRVIFLRHGVAQHNFHGADLHSPALVDPSLTYEGKLGAVQAGERVRQWLRRHEERIELVVCSPLTRTLQTATLAFLPGDEYNHPVPIVCVENVREAFGMHTPDKRREKSLLMVRNTVFRLLI